MNVRNVHFKFKVEAAVPLLFLRDTHINVQLRTYNLII